MLWLAIADCLLWHLEDIVGLSRRHLVARLLLRRTRRSWRVMHRCLSASELHVHEDCMTLTIYEAGDCQSMRVPAGNLSHPQACLVCGGLIGDSDHRVDGAIASETWDVPRKQSQER